MAVIPAPPPPANMWTVFAESKRIINAHSRHFLALSVLFLLPLSFSITVFPTLHNLLASSSSSSSNPNQPQSLLKHSHLFDPQPHHHHHHHHHHQQQQSIDVKSVLLSIGYTSFLLLSSLFASCSITYSVVEGFYGRPVKLRSAIASIATSFFPMLATLICAQAILSLVTIVFAVAMFMAVKGIELIGGDVSYSSPYFVVLLTIAVILVLVVIYLQVEWALMSVIVVAESGWGYHPLRRSAYLVKGMRGVTLSLMLFLSTFVGVLMWSGSRSTLESVSDGDGWGNWAFVVQIVATSSILTTLMLLSLAGNVVLYMYCKAMHGELAMEIVEEFAAEYVSLPFDDEKIPHVVSVASDTCRFSTV